MYGYNVKYIMYNYYFYNLFKAQYNLTKNNLAIPWGPPRVKVRGAKEVGLSVRLECYQ